MKASPAWLDAQTLMAGPSGLWLRGQFDRADTELHRALDIYTRVLGHDHTAVAWVLAGLGALQRQRS